MIRENNTGISSISCSTVLYNSINHVLIAKRARAKRSFPGIWETVGGGLLFGESPVECIRREVREELNCGIAELLLFDVYSWADSHRHSVSIVYSGIPDGDIRINPKEIEEIEWIEYSQIAAYDFCMNCKDRLLDFFTRHPGK